MTEVSVLIPYRAGCPHRDAALEWLLRRYADTFPAWQVVVADGDGDAWSKGAAVHEALHQAVGDVLVVTDADVWCEDTPNAVLQVQGDREWAFPHLWVRRLSEAATRTVLDGASFDSSMEVIRTGKGVRGGGIVVLRREVYDRVPLDPRFEGWGGEDIAWGDALYALAKRWWRGSQPLWHLWHPPQWKMNDYIGNVDNLDLVRRYRRARTRPLAMQVVVDEVLAGRPSTS